MILPGLIILGLFCLLTLREREWKKERAELIQRIQAPEMATQEYMVRQGKREPIPTLPYDDDSAFRAVKEKRDLNGNAG